MAAWWRRGTLGVLGAVLATLSCYGTLAVVALLPLLGLRPSLNDAAWGTAILALTALAVAAIVPGYRRHGSLLPALSALAGGGLIAYVLLVQYGAIMELTGFVLLVAAALMDAGLRRRRTGGQRVGVSS